VRIQRRGIRDGLGNGEVLEQAAVLHDGRDVAAPDGVFGRRAVHAHGAGVRPRESEQHVDRGGLTSAVGAEEGDDLAGLDLETEVVDGGDGSEPLRQIAKVDGEHRVSWG
jgi:hypothetical protein